MRPSSRSTVSMTAYLIAGSLAAAALMTLNQPRSLARFPVHVNDVLAADQFRASVELSLLIEVNDAPATHGESIKRYAGKSVLVEVPIFDDLMRSVSSKGIRARVRLP